MLGYPDPGTPGPRGYWTTLAIWDMHFDRYLTKLEETRRLHQLAHPGHTGRTWTASEHRYVRRGDRLLIRQKAV